MQSAVITWASRTVTHGVRGGLARYHQEDEPASLHGHLSMNRTECSGVPVRDLPDVLYFKAVVEAVHDVAIDEACESCCNAD